MAYHVPVRTIPFEFADGDLKGLKGEFRANLSLDEYFDLIDAAERAGKAKGMEPVRDLLRQVAAAGLVSWNLENGEGPVPVTPENFTRHLPLAMATALVNRYLSEIGGLPGPLAPPSGAGPSSAKRPAKSRPRS